MKALERIRNQIGRGVNYEYRENDWIPFMYSEEEAPIQWQKTGEEGMARVWDILTEIDSGFILSNV